MAKNSCAIRCGYCCISADIILGEIKNEKDIAYWKDKCRWLNLHRCDTTTRVINGKTIVMLRIPFLCANLGIDPKTRKYICKDYDNRPDICKNYFCEAAKKK